MNLREPIPASVIARYTLIVLGILVTAAFFWAIRDALLAAFAGVIVAAILVGMARGLRKLFPLSRNMSLVSVGVILILITGGFGWLFGSQIASEFEDLTQQLPDQISELQETVSQWPMGEQLLGSWSDGSGSSGGEQQNGSGGDGGGEGDQQENSEGEQQDEQGGNQQESGGGGLSQEAGGMAFQAGTTFVSILATLGVILAVGIFFAADPGIYKQGILMLVTKNKVERVDEVLDATGSALWQWLKGQLMAMAFVGIFITVGLWIIGVPLALVLGVIAGLLEFVPYLGPVASFLPAILLAFSESPQTALFTAILFAVVQQLESNVVTPLVQHRMVYIPPSVVILSVVAFGLVFGIRGLILATPLAVVVMVMTGMLYVQDVLGKDVVVPGQGETEGGGDEGTE